MYFLRYSAVFTAQRFRSFYNEKENRLYSRVATATIRGIQSVPVCVEADVSDGMPVFEMVGFLASEVKEARERVRTALRNVGCALPPRRITVNFMPADIRKSGARFDLPIAVAVLAAMGRLPHAVLDDVLIVGEIGLNGVVQPVHGDAPDGGGGKGTRNPALHCAAGESKEAALVSGCLSAVWKISGRSCVFLRMRRGRSTPQRNII